MGAFGVLSQCSVFWNGFKQLLSDDVVDSSPFAYEHARPHTVCVSGLAKRRAGMPREADLFNRCASLVIAGRIDTLAHSIGARRAPAVHDVCVCVRRKQDSQSCHCQQIRRLAFHNMAPVGLGRRHYVLGSGGLGPPPSALSLLLDALDPDHTEAGVLLTNVFLKLRLFGTECLKRVHIGKL